MHIILFFERGTKLIQANFVNKILTYTLEMIMYVVSTSTYLILIARKSALK